MRPPCARRAGSKAGRHRPSAAANARIRGGFRPNAAGFAPAGGETPARWPKKVAARPKKSPKIPQRPREKASPGEKTPPAARPPLAVPPAPHKKPPAVPGPDGPKRHPISFDHPRRNGRTNAPKRKRMKHFSFSFGKKEKNSFRKPPVSVYFIQHIC